MILYKYMKKIIIIIMIIILLLLICKCLSKLLDNYEYFDNEYNINYRCYGGEHNGSVCNIDNSECVDKTNRSDVKCKYIYDKYYCYTLDDKPIYDPISEDNELIECINENNDNMDCPNGICKNCSENITELDGKCGLYDNGCGYPCLYGTELDRSSNGSIEYIDDSGNVIKDDTGIPTQHGCCSNIKLCGIGKSGSELDPCYPNGYCVKCSDMPISWLPDLKISMQKISETRYIINIENNRINDIIYLIPYYIEDGVIIELLPDNPSSECTKWNLCDWSNNIFPNTNENKTSLTYNIENNVDGFIIQLIRLNYYRDVKPYKIGIENNEIKLGGVKQWNIPLNININDIYNIKGDIVKEQLYEERTCSEEFDGIPLNNEPTNNYQCICNNGYITNNNLEDWLPPNGVPIYRNNGSKESESNINIILDKFYHISDNEENREILNNIINQRRSINKWELRNKCKIIDESIENLGSTVSRLGQDYQKIDELWEEGKWNPEEKAGGEHINTMNNIPII